MSDTDLSKRSWLANSLLVGGGVLGVASLASATAPSTSVIKVVDTFADLASTPANVGDIAYVKRHSILKDSAEKDIFIGGGEFIAKSGTFTSDRGTVKSCGSGGDATYWQRFNTDIVTPQMFGARADGIHYPQNTDAEDDTKAIKDAIAAVSSRNYSELYFPTTPASYLVSAPFKIDKRIKITGAGPELAAIEARNFSFGQFVFDFDCIVTDNVEHVEVSGITIRNASGLNFNPNNKPSAIRINNVAYFNIRNMKVYGVSDGVVIVGERTYSISFDQYIAYNVARYSVLFSSTKEAGHYTFVNSTFSGNTGVYIDTPCSLNNVSFVNCNFEKCATNAFYTGGNVFGLSFAGCRTEGCGGIDGVEFKIDPILGKVVAGISITGCFFSPGSVAASPIALGGAGGKVRGFNISGNYFTISCPNSTTPTCPNPQSVPFVKLNNDGESGVISGNYFKENSLKPTNVNRPGVHLFGNENSSTKFADVF